MAPFDPLPPPPQPPDQPAPPFRIPLKLKLWACFRVYLICQAGGLSWALFYVAEGYFFHHSSWQYEDWRRERMFMGAMTFVFFGILALAAAGWGYFRIGRAERRYRLTASG